MKVTELIDGNDFISAQLEISFENLTSHTLYREEAVVRLVEQSKDRITFDAPIRSSGVGHKLKVSIKVRGLGLPLDIELRGRVSEIEPSRNRQLVELTIENPTTENWVAYLSRLQARQANINEFLKNVRGY